MKNSWSQISSARSNPLFLLLAVLIQMSRLYGMLHTQIYCSLGTKSRIDPKRSTWNEACRLQIITSWHQISDHYIVNLHVVCVLLMWQPFYFQAIPTYGMLPYTMIPDYSQLFILRKFLKDLYCWWNFMHTANSLFAIYDISSQSTPTSALCWRLEN